MYFMFLNPTSRWIHSAEALVRPSSVSYGGAKYGRGAQVCSARVSALVMSPSMSSSDRPASAIAFRHASLLKPPQLLSMVTPSQRRSIWDWPGPPPKVITEKLMGGAARTPLRGASRITKYPWRCPLPSPSFHSRVPAEPHVLPRWGGG